MSVWQWRASYHETHCINTVLNCSYRPCQESSQKHGMFFCFGSRIGSYFTTKYPVIEGKQSLIKSSLNTFWKVKSNVGRNLYLFPVSACRISGAYKNQLFCPITACWYIHKYPSIFARNFLFLQASFLYSNLKTYLVSSYQQWRTYNFQKYGQNCEKYLRFKSAHTKVRKVAKRSLMAQFLRKDNARARTVCGTLRRFDWNTKWRGTQR
jgi:hypothetical protein